MLKVVTHAPRLSDLTTILSNRDRSRRRLWWWRSRACYHQAWTRRPSCRATFNLSNKACLSSRWKRFKSSWLWLKLMDSSLNSNSSSNKWAIRWLYRPTKNNKCRIKIRSYANRYSSAQLTTLQQPSTSSRWTKLTMSKCSNIASNSSRCSSRWKILVKDHLRHR